MSDRELGYLVGAVIWVVGWFIARILWHRHEERYWMESADNWNIRFPYLPIETSASMRKKITGK